MIYGNDIKSTIAISLDRNLLFDKTSDWEGLKFDSKLETASAW